jgi:hypothetical protein
MERFDISRIVRLHHADGDSALDDFHNIQHTSIEDRLASFKSGGGDVNKARGIVEDATQLKISAKLLGADGSVHLDEVLGKLNESLPDSNKFILSNGKTR